MLRGYGGDKFEKMDLVFGFESSVKCASAKPVGRIGLGSLRLSLNVEIAKARLLSRPGNFEQATPGPSLLACVGLEALDPSIAGEARAKPEPGAPPVSSCKAIQRLQSYRSCLRETPAMDLPANLCTLAMEADPTRDVSIICSTKPGPSIS